MSVVDAIFPSDASALYDAVAKGDCVKLVLAYAKAVRHAFSVISSRRNISDRSEEKVDEFFMNFHGSPPSSPSWPRPYSHSHSFSFGSYYLQSLLHHPWASSSVMDLHVQAHELDSIIEECVRRTTKQPPVYTGKSAAESSVNEEQNLGIKKPVQHSQQLSSSQMHDDDVRYLGKILSNARPPADFVYAEESRGNSNSSSVRSTDEGNEPGHVLFDGSHGPANGSLIHLACIVESPLILAILFSFGGDPGIRHTAFRRLPIHEAACSGSTDCLVLLLEISQILEDENDHRSNAISSAASLYSGWSAVATLLPTNEDSKPSSHLSGLNHNRDAKSVKTKLVVADTSRFGRISFSSTLQLILDLNTKVENGSLSELEAARLLLRESGIPQGVRTSFAATTPMSTAVDGHGNTALHWASFKNECGCVSVLLESGADANFRSNHFGWTPLHDAAYSDSAEAAALLLEAGANIDSRSNSGATPLCFAAQEDAPRAAALLLKGGADPAVQCNGQHLNPQVNGAVVSANRITHAQSRFSGYTPLHYCAHYNAARAAKVLIEHGAPMEMEDISGRRPIHVAVARGSSDVLQELLYAGTQVETNTYAMTRGKQSVDSGASSPTIGATASSASRLESPLELMNAQAQVLPLHRDNGQMHPQGRMIVVAPALPVPGAVARQITIPGQLPQRPIEVTPVSSPVLKAMIPSRPVHSSKPWNCLTQRAIDECKSLLDAAEGHWSPRTHTVFSPTDRRAVLELLKVGKRLEQMNMGIFSDLWPYVLSFCGRGWFEPDLSTASAKKMETDTASRTGGEDTEEDRKLPARPQVALALNTSENSMMEDVSVDEVHRDEDEDMKFTQFHLESDDRGSSE